MAGGDRAAAKANLGGKWAMNASSSSAFHYSESFGVSALTREVEKGLLSGMVRDLRTSGGESVIAVLAALDKSPGSTFRGEVERLPQLFPGLRLVYGNSMDDFRRQAEDLQKCNAVMWLPPGDASILPQLREELVPRFRWLHSWFGGVEPLVPFYRQLEAQGLADGCLFTNAKGAYSFSLAEWVFAAALHFEKDVPRVISSKAERRWDRFRMGELRGKTMGFLGFGDIAKTTARIAKAFGMRCIALRRRRWFDEEDAMLLDDVFVQSDDDEEKLKVFEQSDFVVVTLPGTPLTKNFCGPKEIAAMKKEAVFINIGRGFAVDEAALAEALQGRRIRGAALDVFHCEPLPPESPLWQAPCLLLTPHNADWVPSYERDATKVFAENFLRFLEGAETPAEMKTAVDLAQGY